MSSGIIAVKVRPIVSTTRVINGLFRIIPKDIREERFQLKQKLRKVVDDYLTMEPTVSRTISKEIIESEKLESSK
jgi:hypothetical protein